jgi:hypothetical protein
MINLGVNLAPQEVATADGGRFLLPPATAGDPSKEGGSRTPRESLCPALLTV